MKYIILFVILVVIAGAVIIKKYPPVAWQPQSAAIASQGSLPANSPIVRINRKASVAIPPPAVVLMADSHADNNIPATSANVDHLDATGNWSGGAKIDGIGNWSGGVDAAGTANWTATEPRFGGTPESPVPTISPTGNWSGGANPSGTANWSMTEPKSAP